MKIARHVGHLGIYGFRNVSPGCSPAAVGHYHADMLIVARVGGLSMASTDRHGAALVDVHCPAILRHMTLDPIP
jgi:hypothetical protein